MAGGFRIGLNTYSLKGKPKEKTPIADYFVYANVVAHKRKDMELRLTIRSSFFFHSLFRGSGVPWRSKGMFEQQ